MKKILMKSISLFCVFAMCITFLSITKPAQAIDNSSANKDYIELNPNNINKHLSKDSEAVNKENTGKINSDMKILGKIGVIQQEDQINAITISSDDSISYLVSIGEYKNIISINSTYSDRIEMTSKQDDISNTVTICDDGRYYVDGKLVQSKADTTSADVVIANSTDYWTDTPIVGSPYDYSYYAFTDMCSDVPLTTMITGITITTFLFLFSLYCVAASIIGFFITVLEYVYTYFCSNCPYTTAISYRAPVYYMNSGVYVPSVQGFAYQYRFAFYGAKNYVSYTYSQTMYLLNLPYV